MNEWERRRLLKEVVRAGTCQFPIRLKGEAVNLATGEVTPRGLLVSCKDRRESVCRACSERYETDAWIIAAAGVNGGKGVPESVAGAPRLFVTVTAPSFGRVHSVTTTGSCGASSGSRARRCPHGRLMKCAAHHEKTEELLGHPLCEECFDAVGAVRWNANATRLWAETMRRGRRALATASGVSRRHLAMTTRLEYVKVVELQRRGLVHFHALVRLDQEEDVLDADQASRAMRRAIREACVTDAWGEYRFGEVMEVEILGDTNQDVRSVATYLAKYVTKSAGASVELTHRFATRRQIANLVADTHLRRLALCAWDDGMRRHAHSLGYRGHFITKSRGYSTTFATLRAARAEYWTKGVLADPSLASYRYEGRGYDDPRASHLAGALAALDRERRREERRTARGEKP